MKKTATLMAVLAVAFAAPAAPVRTATENFVTNKIAAAVAAIPPPDFSTNNTELVETIQAKAHAPDLSGYVPTSRTINGKALTGNVSLSGEDIAVTGTNPMKIDTVFSTLSDTKADKSITNGFVTTSSATNIAEAVAADATNSLAKSLAPTITNTVTKAYVESLGIESGVDAQTVTNMTALTPVYSQTPTYGWLCNPADIDGYPITMVWDDWIQGWNPVANGVVCGTYTGSFDASQLFWEAHTDWDGTEDLTATRVRTDIIGYVLGTQTNSVLAATNSIISAATATNIANSATNFLTRAEAEAGYTEWICNPSTDQLGQPLNVVFTEVDGVTAWYIMVGESERSIAGSTDPDATYLIWNDGEWIDSGTFTATRHRITPTALSQLTNDVGYVTEPTVTDITQSALGSFSATGTVANATDSEYCNSASYANYADVADALKSLTDTRTATQIFTQLDESASTNYAQTAAANAIASADTTYRRTIGLTNLNQSVQYVSITDPAPTTLAIQLPEGFSSSASQPTADWIVYITGVTNVTLQLPPVTWWMADSSATNDIAPATPTALYFSQITTNIFYLGRQSLTEVAP